MCHGIPRYLVKHYFWVCLWGCFGKRLPFEFVGLGKAVCPPRVDGYPSTCSRPLQDKKEEEGWILSFWLTAELKCPSPALELELRLSWMIHILQPAELPTSEARLPFSSCHLLLNTWEALSTLLCVRHGLIAAAVTKESSLLCFTWRVVSVYYLLLCNRFGILKE